MIFSVQTPDYRFRYFEAPGSTPETGSFRAPRGQAINGVFPPQQFLPILPAGAVEVGSGDNAQGIIAALPKGVLEGLPEPVKAVGKFAAWTALGWFLRSLWRR